MDDVKSGLQTTEFWGKTITQVVTLGITAYTAYSGHAVTPDQQAKALQVGLGIAGALEAAYCISRGWIKSKI